MDQGLRAIDAGQRSPAVDSGLIAFVMLARLHGVAVDPGQLKHQYLQGAECFGAAIMLRAAKQFGLKARWLKSSWERLSLVSLPAIAARRDGSFVLLGRVT